MKITLNEWRSAHLFSLNSASDVYYVKLANKMRDYIRFVSLGDDLDEEEQYEVVKCVAYYFEDVISDIGIWGAFVTKHKELYGKYLPFYDIDETEYYLDEINLEDIRFLVWMSIQQFREGSFVDPENPALTELAEVWYALLDKEFEKAPINTLLVEHMYGSQWFDDSFLLKEWCTGLYTTMYLLQDMLEQRHLIEEMEEMAETLDVGGEIAAYAVFFNLAFSSKVGPLALTMPEWISCMLKNRGMEREAALLAGTKYLPANVYLLKGYDENLLTVEDVEGEVYMVERSSLDDLTDDVLQCDVLMCSLVLFNNDDKWTVFGTSSWSKSRESFMQMRKDAKEALERKLYTKSTKTNKDNQLFYFADYDDMNRWMRKNICCDHDSGHPEELEEFRNIAFFIQPDGYFSMLPDGASWIKDDRNPYYDPAAARKNAISLLYNPHIISREMLLYLLEHQLLPDACINSLHGYERGRQLVQDNIDFIARMFRRYMY